MGEARVVLKQLAQLLSGGAGLQTGEVEAGQLLPSVSAYVVGFHTTKVQKIGDIRKCFGGKITLLQNGNHITAERQSHYCRTAY